MKLSSRQQRLEKVLQRREKLACWLVQRPPHHGGPFQWVMVWKTSNLCGLPFYRLVLLGDCPARNQLPTVQQAQGSQP